MARLKDRIALITGGSRGFGAATAEVLAREGADLVLGCRAATDQAEEVAERVRSMGRKAVVVSGDLADPAAIDALAGAALEAFGRIDVLVNNAGVLDDGRFEDQDRGDWQNMINVNILGTLTLTRRLLPQMLDRGNGRIINLTSQVAHTGGVNYSVYAGTKAFLLAFTRSVAREVGPKGVTINAVCPGSILTDMNDHIYPPDEQARKAQEFPLKRWGDPKDIGEAVLYLAAESGDFITGQCVDVNGGNTTV